MSKNSSNPVRELRYVDNDASVGVPMLQKLGIKYLMVFTADARREADENDDLTLVDEVGPWRIYEVAESDLVVPLAVQPVVVNERGGDQRERSLELGSSWFQNSDEWAALPAFDGPADWDRIDAIVDASRMSLDPKRVEVLVPGQMIQPTTLPEVEVSNVVIGDQSVDFDVSQPGVPVLVKISYFPNWRVEGAEGPFRVAPNFMVVVPTSSSVRMEYGMSTIDWLAYLLTLIGIGLLVLWRVQGDVVHATPHPFVPVESPWSDDDGADPDTVDPDSVDEPIDLPPRADDADSV
jgi:hypothetical protein